MNENYLKVNKEGNVVDGMRVFDEKKSTMGLFANYVTTIDH